MADDLVLSLEEARRLAVRGQNLAGPPPAAGIDGMRQVLRGLRVLQIDHEQWRPRTTLLSPFDNLICDRDRTERLWDFTYRNEMYVPKHKRRFGCYVMPVLAGERLIGRVAPRMDRKRGELVVEGVFAEEGSAGSMADAPVAAAIESLAAFAGADSVCYAGPVLSAYPGHG